MKFKLKSIKIPKERFGRDLGDLTELKKSMKDLGRLIEPIVLNDQNELMAGMRRYTAAKELGWIDINVELFHNLTPYLQRKVELDENLHRKDLEWFEKDEQITALHELELSEHGKNLGGRPKQDQSKNGWSIEDTSKEAGVSRATASLAIKITNAIKDDPSLKLESSRKAALSKIKRREMAAIRKILSKRASFEVRNRFLLGDNREILEGFKPESINLILTDIPYDANVKEIYNHGDRMKYEDTEFSDVDGGLEHFLSLRDTLYSILVSGSHLWVFCGFDQVIPIREHFGKKFRVRNLPIIWDKVHKGYCPTPGNMIARNYECLMFMSKGSREFNNSGNLRTDRGDVWSYEKVASSKKESIYEKPLKLIKDIIILSSDEGELVLDPYSGSGVVVQASILTNREGIGIDNNENCIAMGRVRAQEAVEIKFETFSRGGGE